MSEREATMALEAPIMPQAENESIDRQDAVERALAGSENMFRSPRMYEDDATNADSGRVVWKPVKSFWIGTMSAIALIGGPPTATPDAIALFIVTAAVTICLGHSLGMHRRLIHRSYECPLWLERLFVYLGTVVGMAGPFGMIRQHDIRDWAQRKTTCHPYLAHRSSFLRDGYWQLHCELRLDHPPELVVEPRVAHDRFYQFLERTWMAQQIPWAILFYAIGGLPWVVWGIAVRIAVSVTGHWLVGYFAHNSGHRNWHVEGAGVQGYNIPWAGIVTMGEAWHNNHHAYPGSARLAHKSGEVDPGWTVLQMLSWIGLVSGAKTPETLPERHTLIALDEQIQSEKKPDCACASPA
jgi:fatty-acid desaturase